MGIPQLRAGWHGLAMATLVVALAACSDAAPGSNGASGGTGGFTDTAVLFDSAILKDSDKPDVSADATKPDDAAVFDDSSQAGAEDGVWTLPDAQLGDGETDAQAPGDAIDPGLFGGPCVEGADCDSGFCVEGNAGLVCGKLCQGACPAGWTCASLQAPSSDIVNVCVPSYARLCDPCQSAGDCNSPGLIGGVCLGTGTSGKDGSFCATACIAGKAGSCPAGYACKAGGGGNV